MSRNVDKGATGRGTHVWNGQAWHKINHGNATTTAGTSAFEGDCAIAIDSRCLTSSDPALINKALCPLCQHPPTDAQKARIRAMQKNGGKGPKAGAIQAVIQAARGRVATPQ
jgi:hypothetical protein